MKRKKQLLAWIVTFVMVFTSIPGMALFAAVYDFQESSSNWSIDGEAPESLGSDPRLKVGDIIKNTSGDLDYALKIYYRQDGSDLQVISGIINDTTHTVLSPDLVAGLVRPDGKKFLNWKVDAVSISGDLTSLVHLSPDWVDAYQVTYDLNSGLGTPPTDADLYAAGETVTLPAGTGLSRDGYEFIGWSTSKEATVGIANYTMGDADVSLYAVWQPKDQEFYQVTYDLSNMDIIGSKPATVTTGGALTLDLKASSGYKLPESVQVQSDSLPTINYTRTNDSSAKLVISNIGANLKLIARAEKIAPPSGGSSYRPTSYTIEAQVGEGGTITPLGRTSVRRGKDQSFQIKPDEWHVLSKLLIDDKEVDLDILDALGTYTFENVKANHTIEAIFTKKYKELAKGIVTFKIGESRYRVKGEAFPMDAASYLQEPGHTMIPVRYVLEAFDIGGGDIAYQDEIITIKMHGKIIGLRIDSDEAFINGVSNKLRTKLVVRDGRTYAPVAEIVRLLGVQKSWDREVQTATFIHQ